MPPPWARDLGFILQVSGLVHSIPLAYSLVLKEFEATISIALLVVLSLILGFLLSQIPAEGRITLLGLSVMLLLAYLLLSLLAMVPYIFLYWGRMPLDELLPFSFFEGASTVTTTGLTQLNRPELLPKSMTLERSITQWFGGMSIIFLTLIFVKSEPEYTTRLTQLVGFERLRVTSKGNFYSILKVYLLYTSISLLALLATGVDPFSSVNLTLAAVATGGFLPSSTILRELSAASYLVLVATTVAGALNFTINEWLFGRRNRPIYREESLLMLLIISLAAPALLAMNGLKVEDTLFHLLSAVTTSGFQAITLADLGDGFKVLLMGLMFIGGSSFSTAGGIKLIRLSLMARGVAWYVKRQSVPSAGMVSLKLGSRIMDEQQLLSAFSMMSASILILFLSTLTFSAFGYPFTDALFENISAFSNTGLSSGLVSLELHPLLKVLLSLNMILGRVELIPFLIILGSVLGRRL